MGNLVFRGCLSVATAAAALLLQPAQAEACGGFFCNNNQPVNQQAERIIFSKNDDGTVTAIIQIQYTGPSESFAWVIPVEGAPEIGVSSNIVFQRLQAATNPQYTLNRRVEGTCEMSDSPTALGSSRGGGFSNDSAESAPPPTEPGVEVVDAGSVGPYDWVAISVDPEAEEIADVAVEWLQENGYDVDDSGRRTLTPYLMAGMNLVAFRLTKNTEAGSIRPVTITFRTERPGIPIRPTAVAAEDNMGVMVWVLGEDRAIPQNYMHLQLNDALVDWFNPNNNYGSVVSAAADEAGGHGFVTEQAGLTSQLPPILQTWEEQPPAINAGSDLEFIQQVLGRFSGWDGVTEVLATVEFPEGFDVQQFLQCPFCAASDPQLQNLPNFNREQFLEKVESEIIAPVRDAQNMIVGQRFITRLYTTMSAHEMDLDPVFDFNPDLAEVDNTHTADWVIECNPWTSEFEAPWRIELPSGSVVRGEGSSRTWPLGDAEQNLPANARIERLETTGAGQVIEDNVGEIREKLDVINRSGGCSAGGTGQPLAILMLLALGLVRRRR